MITEMLSDPLLQGVSTIAHSLLQELKRKENHPGFVNLVKTCLEKEINQIDGEDVFTMVKKSGLGQLLFFEHGIKMTINTDDTVKCESTKQIDRDLLMTHLQGIKELDQVFYELITYEPSKDLDQVINLLKKFLKAHPYLKDYPSSYQYTLLYAAATTNFLGAAEVLVNDFQCMLDLASGKEEATPAFQAIIHGNMAVYKFLVGKGADREKKSLSGLNPIYFEDLHKLEKGSDKSFEEIYQKELVKDRQDPPFEWGFSDEEREFEDFGKLESYKIQKQVIIGQEKFIREQNIIEIDIRKTREKIIETFHLKLFEPYLSDFVIHYLQQFSDKFLCDGVEDKNIINIRPENQSHPNLDIIVETLLADHLESIRKQVEVIEECFEVASETEKFFLSDREKALEWMTSEFLNYQSLADSKRDLWGKFKRNVEEKVQKTLEDCLKKLEQDLANELINILRGDIIDKEIRDDFQKKCQGYKENDRPLKKVESSTRQLLEEFIRKI